jgi:putative FmdB family regulatory protein
MPTYEYICDACGNRFEKFQSMTSTPIKQCPACKKNKARRLISAGAGLIFKGSGFYITDYRSEGYKKDANAESGGGDSKPAKKDTAAADAKPASSDAKPASGESKPAASTEAASTPAAKTESKSASKPQAKRSSKKR